MMRPEIRAAIASASSLKTMALGLTPISLNMWAMERWIWLPMPRWPQKNLSGAAWTAFFRSFMSLMGLCAETSRNRGSFVARAMEQKLERSYMVLRKLGCMIRGATGEKPIV